MSISGSRSQSPSGIISAGLISGAESKEVHPLRYTWTFWFMNRAPGVKITNYEKAITKIASFSSVEHFWAVYAHLKRPDSVPPVSDYHLFKQGIRPVWEDDANIRGGKYIIRLCKGVAAKFWEDLILGVVMDQFYDAGDQLCGIVLSVRSHEDILSIWTKDESNTTENIAVKEIVKTLLALPPDTVVDYRSHKAAMQEGSSFRNNKQNKDQQESPIGRPSYRRDRDRGRVSTDGSFFQNREHQNRPRRDS